MTVNLKVYGGTTFYNGQQVCAIVAAHSRWKVAELTGESLYHIKGWWSLTGNQRNIELALAKPLEVIYFDMKTGEVL